MSETSTQPSKPIRIALAVSLALNLLIIGALGGAYVAEDDDDNIVAQHPPPPGAVGAFGVFSRAMLPEDRRAIGDALRARGDEFRAGRRAERREVIAVIDALRGRPFDAATLTSVFESQKARAAERVSMGQKALIDRISAMSEAERQEYADRLEEVVNRRSWRP